MNDVLFAESVIPKPYTILGLRLRPFCVGHKAILRRINSPFETGAVPQYYDLILAVLVCSGTFEEGAEMFHDPKLEKKIQAWLKKLKDVKFAEKYEQFCEYLAYNSRHYDFTAISSSGNVSLTGGTPFIHDLIVLLQNRLGLSESEIMNRQWGRALMDYAVIKEQAGTLRVRDAEKVAEIKQCAAEFVESLKRGEVKL